MSSPAAIGLRAHSGWAAAVALIPCGAGDSPVVVMRRRIEMQERGASGPSQPYHAAVGLDLREAGQVISNCAGRAAGLATAGLRRMVEDLEQLGHRVAGCGLLLASGRPLPPLEKILASHPLLHTAEGELFREALRAASVACGLPLVEVRERELFTRATTELGATHEQIQRHLAAMGKSVGPPWRQDEKFAAVAAWLAISRASDRPGGLSY
jgi:hypothetical protein